MMRPKTRPNAATTKPAVNREAPLTPPRNVARLRSGNTRLISPPRRSVGTPCADANAGIPTATVNNIRLKKIAARRNRGMMMSSAHKFLGSSQSRRASPRKLKDKTVRANAIDGKTTMCGASKR